MVHDLLARQHLAAALAIDSHPSTGWGVTVEAQAGRPHALIAALERPLARPAAPEGAPASVPPLRTLTLTLGFQSGWPHPAGEPRTLPASRPRRRHRPFAGLPAARGRAPASLRPRRARAHARSRSRSFTPWFRHDGPLALCRSATARARSRTKLDDMKVAHDARDAGTGWLRAALDAATEQGQLHEPGRARLRGECLRAFSTRCPPTRRRIGWASRAGWSRRGQPADRARGGEPPLGAALRQRARARRARTSARRASRRRTPSCSTGWRRSSCAEGWSHEGACCARS